MSNKVYGVLAILGLGFLAWVWWRSSGPTNPVNSPPAGRTNNRIVLSNLTVVVRHASTNELSKATNEVPRASIPTNPPLVVTNVIKTNAVTMVVISPPPTLVTNTNTVALVRTNAVRADTTARPVQNVYEAQLALARLGISSGSLDGAIGSQTRAALRAYQTRENLTVTGELDAATKASLLLTVPPYTTYTVTTNDLERLQPIRDTWLGKSQQSALDYETILELVAEKGQAHPGFIKRINPGVDWTNMVAGTELKIPNAGYPKARMKVAFIVIHLADKNLEGFDANTNLLVHFPCSIAQRVEKRPVGELHVAVAAPNPNYTFDPSVFPESAEARELKRKLILPPGPNNPVGVAWIGLDKPGYGIHGTPGPEAVGRTESHGCFRLANWNAEYLIRLVSIGTPVYVE